MSACEVCAHTEEHGWYGLKRGTHCRGCHRTWTAAREAHCTVCHRHFSSPSAFDAHLFGPPSQAAEHRDPSDKWRDYAQREDGTWHAVDPRFAGEPSPGVPGAPR